MAKEKPVTVQLDTLNNAAIDSLRSFVERLENLAEDKAGIAEDMKEVMAEAKGVGFDTKILRAVLRIRRMDKAKRQEEEALTDLYMTAIDPLS